MTKMTTGTKIFAWIMVVWNALGVMAFVSQLLLTPEMIALLPEAQQEAYNNIPLWSYVAYALAVFGGLLGTLMLALGKKLAFPLLVLSLVGVLVQQFYNFVIIDSIALLGPSVVILPSLVVVIAIILVMVSKRGTKAGWLK
ncbi:hypothetical protein FJ444_13290 [Aestuariibacter sp. GS-14]|uniref:hypothetical protein n=1 Tax=Aestuariibacter sp. GS-14 TaxID=2590670 RepID=UPI001126A0F5|nr:hypothetical protein [Aestuariibacter sp. GS-14]TPV57363.1 hypothetical protein FJ444_13290 [Aestuariibacter sp. GS-14]